MLLRIFASCRGSGTGMSGKRVDGAVDTTKAAPENEEVMVQKRRMNADELLEACLEDLDQLTEEDYLKAPISDSPSGRLFNALPTLRGCDLSSGAFSK